MPKHSLSMKPLQLVQHTMGRLVHFTEQCNSEYLYIGYIEGGIMWSCIVCACTCKSYFLIPGHNFYLFSIHLVV